MATDRAEELVPGPPGLTFELERFEWADGGRLELVGRWTGLRGHRFLRPTLDVVVDGERRRMLAVLEHKPWAPQEGQDWIAAFTWRGDPAKFEEAELTVSPDLAVELPEAAGAAGAAKAGSRKSTPTAATAEPQPARRPRSAVLEEELGNALAESQELREQLRAEQTNVRGLETQLRLAREEVASAEADRDIAREEAERARGELDRARTLAEAERKRAEAARAETEAALAEKEAARAEGQSARPTLEKLRAELAEARRDRDAAGDAGNAWWPRAGAGGGGRPRAARAATTAAPTGAPPPTARESTLPPTAPDPTSPPTVPESTPPRVEQASEDAAERRTIQIGERPGPLRPQREPHPQPASGRLSLDTWGPRLLAALALVVLAAIVVALIVWAL
jgi:hypothetical protein